MFYKVLLLLDISVAVCDKDTKFSDKGYSAVDKRCKVVSKTGSGDQIFFACVGEIFGTIPDRTGSVGCFLGSVGVFYNFVVLRFVLFKKCAIYLNKL